MTAILTKYVGPTNTKGSRIVAYTGDVRPSTGKPDRLTIGYNHRLNTVDNHKAAAKALAERVGMNGAWFGDGLTNGMAFVRVNAPSPVIGEETRSLADFIVAGF